MVTATPTHRAYCRKWVNRRAFTLLEVGTAYPHSDGKGFDIRLDRLPVDGVDAFDGVIRLLPWHQRPEEAAIIDAENKVHET